MVLVQAIGAAFWNFLYCPPLIDCRWMRSCSRAASSNSSWRPFHWPHRTNLLHTTWPVSSRRTSYRMPAGFLVIHIMAYPFGSGGKITVGNGVLKMETPPKAVLHPGRRLDLSYTNVYAGSLAKSYAYPGPSLLIPNRAVPYQGATRDAMMGVRGWYDLGHVGLLDKNTTSVELPRRPWGKWFSSPPAPKVRIGWLRDSFPETLIVPWPLAALPLW